MFDYEKKRILCQTSRKNVMKFKKNIFKMKTLFFEIRKVLSTTLFNVLISTVCASINVKRGFSMLVVTCVNLNRINLCPDHLVEE